MSEQISFVVGIDLCNDFTQVCIFDPVKMEPESMSILKNEQKYLIPTCLVRQGSNSEWLVGEEAKRSLQNGEGYEVEHLLTSVGDNHTILIDEVEYKPEVLLHIYLAGIVRLIKECCESEPISNLVVTMEHPDEHLTEAVIAGLEDLGIPKMNILVSNHSESFLSYTVNQSKELWGNDVLLYDFNRESFTCRRMSLLRNRTPQILLAEEQNLTDKLPYSLLESEESRQKADQVFTEIFEHEFTKGNISSIFLTGNGFYEEWAKQSLPRMCRKHRVFLGHNLYVKGACYTAAEHIYRKEPDTFTVLCEGRTKVDISLLVEKDGKQIPLILSKAGTNWYQAGAEIECILDEAKEVQFIVTSALGKESQTITVELDKFPERPRRVTRVSLAIVYRTDSLFSILIKDKGFGEFFPSSEKMIRKDYHMDDFI